MKKPLVLTIGAIVMYDTNYFIEDEYEPHKEPYPVRITAEDFDIVDDWDCFYGIPLTPEILEYNNFKKDGYTNLSYDYILREKDFEVFVNLKPTPDKHAQIIVYNLDKENKKRIEITDEGLKIQNKEYFCLHDLHNAVKMAGIKHEFTIQGLGGKKYVEDYEEV